jgi:hypothetical protein
MDKGCSCQSIVEKIKEYPVFLITAFRKQEQGSLFILKNLKSETIWFRYS